MAHKPKGVVRDDAHLLESLARTQAANLFNIHAGGIARRLADKARIRYQNEPKPPDYAKPPIGPYEPPVISEYVERVVSLLDDELWKIIRAQPMVRGDE